MTSYRMLYDIICAKNTRWPDRHKFVMFHIIAYLLVHCNGIICHTKVYEETFDVNSKIALATQNIYKFLFGKSSVQLNGKFRWMSRRFHTLIWRLGDTVQNMESPGSSGRIDMHWSYCNFTQIFKGRESFWIIIHIQIMKEWHMIL